MGIEGEIGTCRQAVTLVAIYSCPPQISPKTLVDTKGKVKKKATLEVILQVFKTHFMAVLGQIQTNIICPVTS